MFLPLGLAVAGLAVYAWLSSEEQYAMDSYHRSSRRLSEETYTRRQQLNSYRKGNQAVYEYHKYVELHYQAVQTAGHCFAHYDEQKQLLVMLDGKIQQHIAAIIKLKKQRDQACGMQKQRIREQLQTMRGYLTEAKGSYQELKVEKQRLLTEVRELNQQTKELKLYIKDHCGSYGNDWYQRSLERRKSRLT